VTVEGRVLLVTFDGETEQAYVGRSGYAPPEGDLRRLVAERAFEFDLALRIDPQRRTSFVRRGEGVGRVDVWDAEGAHERWTRGPGGWTGERPVRLRWPDTTSLDLAAGERVSFHRALGRLRSEP
jgi:hypothetical protein